MFLFILKSIKYIAIAIVSWYVLLLLALYLFQWSLLFFPSKPYLPHYEKISQDSTLRNFKIQTPDGSVLDGWMQIDSQNKKTILYFGWNWDEISYFIEKYRYKNINFIALNYRGYAYSTWYPSEQHIFADAEQIYDFVIQDLRISPSNLYVMWRSLGTGVATYIASKRVFAWVILVTPFDSVENVAKGSYWFVPVSILLKNKFESYKYAQVKVNPLLCIYGWLDYTIPNHYTENLLTYWNWWIKKLLIETANHDNIYSFHQVQESIERFVR